MTFLKSASIVRATAAIGVLITCAACTTNELPTVVKREPIIVPRAAEVKPVALDRVAVRIPRSQVIGQIQRTMLCIGDEDITYRGGSLNLEPEIYSDIFREELEAANYEVAGDPNSLFRDRDADRVELVVGGLVKDLNVNICYRTAEYSSFVDPEAEAVITVEWQVYNVLSRDVVYTVTTQGQADGTANATRGAVGRAMNEAGENAVFNAFGEAARNLLAERDFYNLVSSRIRTADPATLAPTVSTTLPALDLRAGRFQDVVTETRANVVTLVTGSGMGSGFFVSDNLLLTNEHVVGGSQFVVVKTVTGREMVGEVVATNSARDIALVSTESSGLRGLPLRLEDPPISSLVYVIGTPLEEANESTVSAGIISAYRTENGLRYIQSGNSGGPMFDSSGNVIGVSVSGMMAGGVSIGLNRFIPINDALSALNIQVSGDQI